MEEHEMRWDIKSLVGEDCITIEDGEKIYDLIHPVLLAGHEVELDFAGVGVFASPFFNAAFGRLLKDFTPEHLDRMLKILNLTPVGRDTLKLVIKNSVQYYSDPAFQKALNEILVEQSEEL